MDWERRAAPQAASVRLAPIDILFVVDNSGSMADEQELLARSFERFIDQISSEGNYHIGIISTDQSSDTELSGSIRFAFSDTYPFPSLPERYDYTLCLPETVGHGCFRGPNSNTRMINSSALSRNQQIRAFEENVLVGSCGADDEQGLNAVLSALDQTVDGCNQNFIRPQANLLIILVSDEDDHSCGDVDCQGATDFLPVDQLVDRLGRYKRFDQIRVATIVGAINGRARNCNPVDKGACGTLCNTPPPAGSNRPCSPRDPCDADETCVGNHCQNRAAVGWNRKTCAWCSRYAVDDCCSALSGNRYVQFAQELERRAHQLDPGIVENGCRGAQSSEETSACLVDSICQEDFGSTLANIARELVVPRGVYLIEPSAERSPNVMVRVHDAELKPEEFRISPDGGSLTITNPQKIPDRPEQIDVYFTTERAEIPFGSCVTPRQSGDDPS